MIIIADKYGIIMSITFAELAPQQPSNPFNGVSTLTALEGWALTQAFTAHTLTRDSNGAIVTANIVWPDDVPGVFITDVASVAFPGAVDAWHATYASTPAKTITQPTVTRDVNGAVIAQPDLIIS